LEKHLCPRNARPDSRGRNERKGFEKEGRKKKENRWRKGAGKDGDNCVRYGLKDYSEPTA